jgi:hypothetical protein
MEKVQNPSNSEKDKGLESGRSYKQRSEAGQSVEGVEGHL